MCQGSMPKVGVVNPMRTAIGSFNGALASVDVPELGARVIEKSIENIKAHVEEVYMGNVLQVGIGQNPARQAAMKAGLSIEVPASTINTVCGSGLHSVAIAYNAILAGQIQTAVAGGMENMSSAPYILKNARNGYRLGDGKLIDTLVTDGLTCPFNQYHMGITAENIAEKYGISRTEQDEFAYESQIKAAKAKESGVFASEIVPITIKKRKEEILVSEDEYIRGDTTVEKLSKLRPAFKSDGSVTAGNASGINDGAASMVVMSDNKLHELGIRPFVYINGYTMVGIEPELMGLGPIKAVQKLLSQTGMNKNDIDLWELNEAFAVQSIAVVKELGIDKAKVNISGGAIALGHPIGASGSRILVTLAHALKREGKRFGVASLCIGTGMGIAMLIENTDV